MKKGILINNSSGILCRRVRPVYGTSARLIINTDNGIFYDSIKTAWESYGRKVALSHFGEKIRGNQRNYTPFVYA